MKKRIRKALAIGMAVLFCLSVCSVYAEEPLDIPPMDKKGIDTSNSDFNALIKKQNAEKSIDLTTDDQVTVLDDGSVKIVALDVSMTILPPFGWIVLSQDVLSQLDTYMMLTDDIETLLNTLKSSNTHAFALDLLSGTNVQFRLEEDSLSKLFVSMDNVNDSYMEKILPVMKTSYGVDDISVISTGNNKYFKIDGRSQGYKVIIYSTYINGKTLDVCCYPGEDSLSDYDVESIESMLTDLVLG